MLQNEKVIETISGFVHSLVREHFLKPPEKINKGYLDGIIDCSENGGDKIAVLFDGILKTTNEFEREMLKVVRYTYQPADETLPIQNETYYCTYKEVDMDAI